MHATGWCRHLFPFRLRCQIYSEVGRMSTLYPQARSRSTAHSPLQLLTDISDVTIHSPQCDCLAISPYTFPRSNLTDPFICTFNNICVLLQVCILPARALPVAGGEAVQVVTLSHPGTGETHSPALLSSFLHTPVVTLSHIRERVGRTRLPPTSQQLHAMPLTMNGMHSRAACFRLERETGAVCNHQRGAC